MSSSVKAKPQTFSTGLYGSATTNKYGTTYNPSSFENQLINMTNTYIPQYMEQLVNPTYDSAVFKAQTAQRNRLANQSFENNLINPLALRGLTRGSSINQMSNQFANKLADLEVDAMANEDARNSAMLNNLFGYYQIPYNMMMGISNYSNNQYQHAYQNALAEAQMKNEAMSNWAGALSGGTGTMTKSSTTSGQDKTATQKEPSSASQWGSLLGGGAGYYFGGPAGAQVGSMIGGNLGEMLF